MSGADFCPVAISERHCQHWYDGASCCLCNADPPSPTAVLDGAGTRNVSPAFIDPTEVVCPLCRAAKGARCTERKPLGIGGHQFINTFHAERTALTRRAG